MLWVAPFGKEDVKTVYTSAQRIASLQYSEDCQTLFLTQTADNQRQVVAVDLRDPTKTYVIHKGAAAPAKGPGKWPIRRIHRATTIRRRTAAEKRRRLLRRWSRRRTWTTLMTRSSPSMSSVVRMSRAGEVYLAGTDRSKMEGKSQPRPYIEKIDVKTGRKARIYEGKGEMTETIDAVDGDDIKIVFTTRQLKDVVPDSYMTDLQTGKVTKLTNNIDNSPWYHKLKTDRFQVTRVDGFKFWVKVTLPEKVERQASGDVLDLPAGVHDQASYNAVAGTRWRDSDDEIFRRRRRARWHCSLCWATPSLNRMCPSSVRRDE